MRIQQVLKSHAHMLLLNAHLNFLNLLRSTFTESQNCDLLQYSKKKNLE